MTLSREVKIGQRTVQVPVTIMDRIVDFFSPAQGQARFNTRLRMAIGGGYTGADWTRRANQQRLWRTEMSADRAIVPDLITLREDSQHMIRNNAIARGAVLTNITKVVGTGLKVKPQIDSALLKLDQTKADEWQRRAYREFILATETREIDAERQLPFSLLQGLAFLKVLEDGDMLVNMPRFARAGSPYKLKLQFIEAARLSNPNGVANTTTLCTGVEKDATGAPVRYHISDRHPGSLATYGGLTKMTWQPLEAFGKNFGTPLVLHLLDKTRPGQTRAVPYITPIIELIKQLGRYTDAEVMAAVVSGMVTAFITTDSGEADIQPAPNQVNPDSDPSKTGDPTGMELGYGSVIGLLPGEKIETVNPGRPNTAFDPFVMAVLRQIGMALELPFEVLVKHFTASYSASRAALMEAWDYFRRRRHWLVVMLCQPVYEAVITEAVASGRLTAPGFFADPLIQKAWLGTTWIGDAPYHLDPLKEVNAAKERMNSFLTTHDEEVAAMPQGGFDWEAKGPQFVKESKFLKDNDLLPEPSVRVTEAGVAPAQPEPNMPESDMEAT